MHNCAGNNSQFLQLDHCRDLCQTFLRTSLADVIPEVSARMAFSWISDFLADSPPSLAVCEVSVLSRVAMQQDCAWLFFIPWFMSSAYDDRVIELITKLWTWEVSLTCRQVCSLCPKWLDALGTLSCFLWKLYKLVRGWVGHVVITDLWVLSGDSWPRTSFWSEKLQTWLLLICREVMLMILLQFLFLLLFVGIFLCNWRMTGPILSLPFHCLFCSLTR